MQDPTDAKTLWMRERQAELAEATVQGVFRLTQEMAEAQSLVSETDVATFHGGERPEEVAPDIPAEPELVAGLPRNVTLRMALVTLDEVDPVVVFQRAVVMKSVPHVLRGPFRTR